MLLVGHLSRLLPKFRPSALTAKWEAPGGATAAKSVSSISCSVSPPFAFASPYEGVGAPIRDGGEFHQPLQTHLGPVFRQWAVQAGLLCPGLRPLATSSAGTWTNLPVIWHCNHLSLRWLSSGNQRQWAREHLARRPSSGGSAGCHGGSSVPRALCQTFAPRWRGCTSFTRRDGWGRTT
jgi:hypothetical protein